MPIDTIDSAWREDNILGDAGSGKYKPLKAPMRRVLKRMEALSAAGVIHKATFALLDAITPPTENYGGAVYDDPDPTKNGFYVRDTADWVWARGFPDTMATAATIIGTADAIGVTIDPAVNPADIDLLFLPSPIGTNTIAGVTIEINGGAAADVKAASGAALAVGDIIEGVGTLLFRRGAEWRQLYSSQVGASVDHQGDWSAVVTYTESQFVTGSNGNWYQLDALSSLNDDPVTSVTGDWLLVLVAGALGAGSVTEINLASALKSKLVAAVATRTALAAIDAATYLSVDLMETGRRGRFHWHADDLSAKVTLDPAQGVYVAPATDATGASGAWVREFSGDVHAEWFGFATSGTATANTLAANRAAAVAEAALLNVRFPGGEFEVDAGATCILLRQGMRFYGAGWHNTIFMARGGGTLGEVRNYQRGRVFGRSLVMEGPNAYIMDAQVDGIAIVLNHPSASITTTELQCGVDLRCITRSRVTNCWIGNYHPKTDAVKGGVTFTRPYLVQGWAVLCGTEPPPAYCGGEVNVIDHNFIPGNYWAIAIDHNILSPQSAAYSTRIENNDIQVAQILIIQVKQYGAANVIRDNVLQATQLQQGNGDTIECGIWIEGYGNFIEEPYGEYGTTCTYILRFHTQARRNRAKYSGTCSVTGGIVTESGMRGFVDAAGGTSYNIVEFFADTGGGAAFDSLGTPQRMISGTTTTQT
jgi:hypothetical protein